MTSPATDVRHSERMRALIRANEVRHARADLKRRVSDGELSAAQIILAPPRDASSWPVVELLRSQPGWGEARSRGFLAEHQIDERKPIGTLTGRQRRLLAARLTPTHSQQGDSRSPTSASARMSSLAHPPRADRQTSPDIPEVAKEGVASSMEKRAPHFPDQVTSDSPEVFDGWTSPPFS